MTTPRPPRFESEEEVLLSAFLDGELTPEDRLRALALLSARPEAVEWLALARRIGDVGRETWGGFVEVPEAANVASQVADAAIYPVADQSAPLASALFGRFRRDRGNGRSRT